MLLAGVLYVLYLVQSRQIEAFVITSESMEPILHVGNTHFMLPAGVYERGQIVVFRSPENQSTQLVKRLVGLPGDKVELREGLLFVNGLEAAPPVGGVGAIDLPDREWLLHPDEFFLVGDNRTFSHDSREFGPVPRRLLQGVLDQKPVNNRWWHRFSREAVKASE